jgi:hypothetical protein
MKAPIIRAYLAGSWVQTVATSLSLILAICGGAEPSADEPYRESFAAAFALTPQSTDQPTIPVVSVSARALPEAFGKNAPLRLTAENRPVVCEMLKRIVLMSDNEAAAWGDAQNVVAAMRGFVAVGATADDLAFLSRFFDRVDASNLDRIPDEKVRSLYLRVAPEGEANDRPISDVQRQISEIQYGAMHAFSELAVKTELRDVAVPSLAKALAADNPDTVDQAAKGLATLNTNLAVQALVDRLKYLEDGLPTTWTAKDEVDYANLSRGGEMSALVYSYIAPSAIAIVRELLFIKNVRGPKEAGEALARWKLRYQDNPQARAILAFLHWQDLSDALKEASSKSNGTELKAITEREQSASLPADSQSAIIAAPTSINESPWSTIAYVSVILFIVASAIALHRFTSR